MKSNAVSSEKQKPLVFIGATEGSQSPINTRGLKKCFKIEGLAIKGGVRFRERQLD